MGALLDLLTSEMFRKRTAMYVGVWDVNQILPWLRGFEYAQSLMGENDLEGFKEWLQINFMGQANTHWTGIIAGSFQGDDEAILEKFFEELDKFLEYRDEVGINQIIDEHEAYEIRRYGRVHSGRLTRH